MTSLDTQLLKKSISSKASSDESDLLEYKSKPMQVKKVTQNKPSYMFYNTASKFKFIDANIFLMFIIALQLC